MAYSQNRKLFMKYLIPLLLGSALLSAPAMAGSPATQDTKNEKHAAAETVPGNHKEDTPSVEDKYAKQRKTFQSHDHNKDGVVADFEFIKDMKQLFKNRDANEDGEVTRKENFYYFYRQYEAEMRDREEEDKLPPSVMVVEYEALFDLEDQDKDGIVTEYENLGSYRKIFNTIDTDKDGTVDWDEYIAFVKSQK